MARTADPSARERILRHAGRLFREHGVRAVGIQQIIDDCGCGKSLVYREFASKDELVVAYLEANQAQWDAFMDDAVAAYARDPARQLVAMVEAATAQVAHPGWRGCPFRAAYAHFPTPEHPAHQVSLRHVEALRDRLRTLAARTTARDPNGLADRLLLIIDGVYTNGSMLGAQGPVEAAVPLARSLVRASTATNAGASLDRPDST